jgi:hypothetical protein
VDDRPVKPPGTSKHSGYVDGYRSEDDKGRIFTNRNLDGTWLKDRQCIEITVLVAVSPAGCSLPSNAKIEWTFEDPDDPTIAAPRVHPDSARLIEPNAYDQDEAKKANAHYNDPRRKATATAHFEESDRKLVTPVAATGSSTVRFHVSDVGGDNYRVYAKPILPGASSITAAQTGVMTVWDRIEIEYVKMASASELPVDQIAPLYEIACVQMDVSERRVVEGAFFDLPHMGNGQDSADEACDNYVKKDGGVFRHEFQGGWFCLVAANRLVPALESKPLFEGPATVLGNKIQFPVGTELERAKTVRVFNPKRIGGMWDPYRDPYQDNRDLHIKFDVKPEFEDPDDVLTLAPHDFYKVDDSKNAFLYADISLYGFGEGDEIPVQVLSEGDASLNVGRSPGAKDTEAKILTAGKLIVFTSNVRDHNEMLIVICHEFGHAFGNAHKCGNWDWEAKAGRTSCCMNYWYHFLLDEASPRRPILWTQNRQSPKMCGQHIVSIRDSHLEDNPQLGWL